MKYAHVLCLCLLLLPILFGCKQHGTRTYEHPNFITTQLIKHTPIKDQGDWPCGWIYSSLALVESERILVGDSLNLSATFVLRQLAEERQRAHKSPTNLSGTPFLCFQLLEERGTVLYQSYRPQPLLTYNTFQKIVNSENLHIVCDTGFAYLPPSIGLYGAVYSPTDLGRSLFVDRQYEGFTSIGDVPLEQQIPQLFPEESRDNFYTNKSPESLVQLICSTLCAGQSLIWMGDTTTASYATTAGYAYCSQRAEAEKPRSLKTVQSISPKNIHCMQIIGIARAPHPVSADSSKRFFVCKDSHGTDTPYHGYFFLSENYVKTYTCAIYRHRPLRQTR